MYGERKVRKRRLTTMDTHKASTEEVDIIDIEAYAREGKPVPKGKRYRIRIDKETKVVNQPSITGTEILSLVGKTPDAYYLYEHARKGQTRLIQPDEVVDLTVPGVERFTTLKKENTEG
jgi:hypothetical protein